MAADLTHITGACANCKREGLPASDFIEYELRRFLAERLTARNFTDIRGEMHSETKAVQVAGSTLCCRACVEAQSAAAAAADSVWAEDDSSSSGTAIRGGTSSSSSTGGAALAAAAIAAGDSSSHADQEEEDVADSWEDL